MQMKAEKHKIAIDVHRFICYSSDIASGIGSSLQSWKFDVEMNQNALSNN
jgi:hypothetical protein